MVNQEKILSENIRLKNENKALKELLERNNNAIKTIQNKARNFIAELNIGLMYNDKK